MIVMDYPVGFGSFVQPICLWDSTNDPPITLGLVIGYGKSEDQSKRHENIPKVIKVPVYQQEQCFLSNPALVRLSSTRTFCGGPGDGTGVCSGDSGGALIMQDTNGAFYLRGIVSSSLISDFTCDVRNYAIFTNVLKYKDWIKTFTKGFSVARRDDECGIMSSSNGLIQGENLKFIFGTQIILLLKF